MPGMDELAKAEGLERTIIKEARFLLTHASPEVLAQVEAGTLSVYAAKKIVDTVKSQEEQARVIESVTKDQALSGKPTSKLSNLSKHLGIESNRRGTPRKSREVRIQRYLDALGIALDGLREAYEEAGPIVAEWNKALEAHRRKVSNLINTTRETTNG